MHSVSDEDERSLVGKCLAGNKQAWDLFFEQHYKAISSIAAWRKWGFDQAEQEDVIQDIVEGVIKSLPRFEFKARVSTFVYRISVSSCIAALRKRSVRKKRIDSGRPQTDGASDDWEDRDDQGDASSMKNPEKLLLHRESISSVQRALMTLGAP